mmetsp:Transcript_24736/g.44679  ORF Transcript_24736/g.44679 Transcript_24736/m.44679 type:complete len:205 (+) Transcript_24736:266-880(+)
MICCPCWKVISRVLFRNFPDIWRKSFSPAPTHHLSPNNIEEEPNLRHGSFAGVLEEYVEGKLFYTWLYGDNHETNAGNSSNQRAVGKILLMSEIPLKLSMEDYFGGLCDLTGEIGRYAVSRGTVRDKESVKVCVDSSQSIYMTLKMLGKLPRNVSKKMTTLSKSVDKLDRVLYEQSLMEMTGRKEFATGVEVGNPAFDSNFTGD